MSSRRPVPRSRFGALLTHTGPLVHVTRTAPRAPAPAPAPIDAIFDDERLTVDMLLSIAAKANCASIAALASTSAAVRALMREDFFWRVLGEMRGYDMPSEQEVGMTPYQIFWAACMQGERDARERQRLLDAQLQTALNVRRWDEALVAVRAGADPNVDVGGGRRALDADFPFVIRFFTADWDSVPGRESDLVVWTLMQELAGRGGRAALPMRDAGELTRRSIVDLKVDALRFLLKQQAVDLSDTRSVLNPYPMPWLPTSSIRTTSKFAQALDGRIDPPPGALDAVRRTGLLLGQNDALLLRYAYLRAAEGGDTRRIMRERTVVAFTNGQALVDEFEAAAAAQPSRVPPPPPAGREQARLDPMRVLYDMYRNAAPNARAALMKHAKRTLDRELPGRNAGPAAPAVSAIRVYTMIEEHEKGAAGQARARQLFREWLRGPLLGPVSEATRESARRLGEEFGEITQRQDAQAAEPASTQSARADDEARRVARTAMADRG